MDTRKDLTKKAEVKMKCINLIKNIRGKSSTLQSTALDSAVIYLLKEKMNGTDTTK